MSNKFHTDQTLKTFLSKKQIILRKIANNTVNYFQNDVFETQGAAIGSRWKQSERSKKDGGLTLQKTGAGKRSIGAKVFANKATIKPSLKYMSYHQLGSGKNPVRKFMGNSSKLGKENSDIIKKEMDKV